MRHKDHFGAFEITIKSLDVQQKLIVLDQLVENDFDVLKTCEMLGLKLAPNPITILESDLAIFLRRISKLTHDSQRREITSFFNMNMSIYPTENMKKSMEDLPDKSMWQKLKFQELLDEVDSEQHPVLKEMFCTPECDIVQLRQMLNLPPLIPNDVDEESVKKDACKEFKAILIEQFPIEQHKEAMLLLQENDYNVELTCNHIGLKRKQSTKPHKSPTRLSITPKFVERKVVIPSSAWPDAESCKKADYDSQIISHPTIIDLHYYTLQEADEAVKDFIDYHQKFKSSKIHIITGRGFNSQTKHTIKKQTIKFLRSKRIPFVVDTHNCGQLVVTLI